MTPTPTATGARARTYATRRRRTRVLGLVLTGRHDRMSVRRSRAFLTLLSFRADSLSDVIGEHTRTRFFEELVPGQLGSMRRKYAVGAGLFVAAGVAIGVTHLGRGTFSSAVADLGRAQPGWLVAAAL